MPITTSTATVYVQPPPSGTWTSYTLTVCPLNGGSCLSGAQLTCTLTNPSPTVCPLTALTPEVSYVITAVATNGGTTSPVSNEDQINMPSPAPPVPASCNTQTDCAPSGRICNLGGDYGASLVNKCICPTGERPAPCCAAPGGWRCTSPAL